MPYDEFKKRIDTARNILVGAVPSPAGQIDQITYALMYKFMNDIDDQSAALPGGKRTYFTGDYEKYNWHNLMSPSLGAHERLELYRQAVQGMAKNDNLPPLFREIYQNAFLPFNSSHVLTLFLKEIDKFSHGESDDIGDAYEYLLSITGSQGDVGQFRTPRHIIKFIVKAVNPTKDDKVLDPAVGTAGFLIAAYKHVMGQHDGKDESGKLNNETSLNSDERDKLHKNYRGFDIDPTMVRTASVNMYLHGFSTPDIINHDSLSSEEYWNDKYDVILANPPFMTPKGGIQPHKKFTVAANRAEVLFVDYIASHLKPNGRAGIVVPEGIIFQSGNAYKRLRKNLVENYLYAVVSLPAGVFQPYSGVKTSILLLDRELAKRNEILFVKVENDGFSSGAQRRPMPGNQLPEALERIDAFKCDTLAHDELAHTVLRSEIAESGDYNLSGDRYKLITVISHREYPLVKLPEVVAINQGCSEPDKIFGDSNFSYVDVSSIENHGTGIVDFGNIISVKNAPSRARRIVNIRDTLISTVRPNLKAFAYIDSMPEKCLASTGFAVLTPNIEIVIPKYIYWIVLSDNYVDQLVSKMGKGAYPSVNTNDLNQSDVPLPPIEIQYQIVAELDSYQKIIDAAQIIVKSYKPIVKIDPEWEIVKLGDLCVIGSSKRVFEAEWKDRGVPFYRAREIVSLARDGVVDNKLFISEIMFDNYSQKYGAPREGDIMVTGVGTLGVTYFVKENDKFYFKDGNIIWLKDFSDKCDSKYIERLFTTEIIKKQIRAQANGGTVGTYTITAAKNTKFPLPPIEIQRQIVAELEAEQQLINANKKLIEIYQQKIKDRIAEVWGE